MYSVSSANLLSRPGGSINERKPEAAVDSSRRQIENENAKLLDVRASTSSSKAHDTSDWSALQCVRQGIPCYSPPVGQSPERVVFRCVPEHTSLCDGSLMLDTLVALTKTFPEAREYFASQIDQGKSSTLTRWAAGLKRVTRLRLPDALAQLCGNPAGISGASRLTDEQQVALLKLMSVRQMDRSMLMLSQAGLLRPGASVMRCEGTGDDGKGFKFDLVMSPWTSVAWYDRLISDDRLRAQVIEVCQEQVYWNRDGEPFGVEALLIQIEDRPGSVARIPHLPAKGVCRLPPDGARGEIVLITHNCAPLLESLATNAGIAAWLAGGYFPLFVTPDRHHDLQSLVNFSYSDAMDECDFLRPGLYVRHSKIAGSGFRGGSLSGIDLTGVRAFGAEIDIWPSRSGLNTKQDVVQRLSEVGVIGLDPEKCVELSTDDPDLLRIRLNDAPDDGDDTSV